MVYFINDYVSLQWILLGAHILTVLRVHVQLFICAITLGHILETVLVEVGGGRWFIETLCDLLRSWLQNTLLSMIILLLQIRRRRLF